MKPNRIKQFEFFGRTSLRMTEINKKFLNEMVNYMRLLVLNISKMTCVNKF